MNINSVIVSPQHNEIISLNNASLTRSHITFRGYAYSGDGKPIIRVELSTDDGHYWHLCEHAFPPNPEPYGFKRHYTWCFWV